MQNHVLENLRYLLSREQLPNISNADYVKSLKLKRWERIPVLETLKKYDDVKWWLSGDLRVKAYAQINEKQLVIPLKDYDKGMGKLVKRDAYVHSLMRPNALRDEAGEKMEELISGLSNQA